MKNPTAKYIFFWGYRISPIIQALITTHYNNYI